MKKNNVIQYKNPEEVSDPLTEILRIGAKKLLSEAIDAEVTVLLSQYQECRDEHGKQQIVRNGYLPERTIQTGIGSIPVHVPRIRDRSGAGINFASGIIPPYLACREADEATTLDKICILPFFCSNTAAAVSSQEVSIPKIIIDV